MKKILVTGGDGRFAKVLKNKKSKFKFIFRNKKQLNILSKVSIINNIKKFKPNYILHLAGLSRPMKIHEKNVKKSLDLNIIGTANVVKACIEKKLKIIHFSTSYVYPGKKGKYKEEDPLLPWNNYGWSKLGGECAVNMFKNSLVIRVNMTEMPFVHKKAFANVKINLLYHHQVAEKIFQLINKRGIINLGGKPQTIYSFVKKNNPKVKKGYADKNNFPKNLTMNLSKLKKIIR